MTSMKRVASAFTLAFSCVTAAAAQLPSPSPRALGMGDNYTASARGFEAVSWNPAMLGMADGPRNSFTVLPVRGVAGLDPVTLADFKDFEGQFVPASVREQWLTRIEGEGTEQGTVGLDATYLALQIGRVGFQVASSARAVADLSPGAAELLLFGNAGRTGQPRSFDLNGSSIASQAVTTVALSYGIPLGNSSDGTGAVGITAKYTMGHMLMLASDQGSQLTATPTVDLDFPVVGTSTDEFELDNGNGFGLDIGFAVQRGRMTVAGAIQNVVNTFGWNDTKLTYREGSATFDGNVKESDFDEQPLANAPAALRGLVDDARFKPVLAAGLAVEASRKLTISADVRSRVGDTTMPDVAKLHAGIGAEFRPVSVLSLRAGGALLTGGFQIGGGVGLNIGPLNLAASIVSRDTDLGKDMITMFSVISIGH